MRRLLSILVLASLPALARDLPWQSMNMVGSARLSYMFWPVYDARLYTPSGDYRFADSGPFALQLEYRRAFSGQALVEETRRQWQEMGLEEDPSWIPALAALLPDVTAADAITLHVDSAGTSRFYFNDILLGSIDDSAFSRAFAAIWLSPATSRPDLRNTLLGEKP